MNTISFLRLDRKYAGWEMSYPEKSYYDTLGVPRNASDVEIKNAYREQIRFFHPDVFQGSPEIARQKSQELNEAYSVLSDPVRRDAYDAWLRMKDYQKAQKQKKAAEEARRAAAEEARQAEARRKEQEEREQQEREAEAQQEEPEPEQPTEEPRPAASTRFRRRVSSLNVVLAGCLLLSIVSGVIVNSRTRQLLSDTQAQLEEAEATCVQLADDAIRLQELRDFYKRAEECCEYVLDTFRDMYSITAIYTTVGDAESFRESVRERIESDLSLAEDCFAECEQLEVLTGEDAALLSDVQQLCGKAFEYLDRLESGRQAEAEVARDASSNAFDAIAAVSIARDYYWELTRPE